MSYDQFAHYKYSDEANNKLSEEYMIVQNIEDSIIYVQEMLVYILTITQIFEWLFMIHILRYQKDKEPGEL